MYVMLGAFKVIVYLMFGMFKVATAIISIAFSPEKTRQGKRQARRTGNVRRRQSSLPDDNLDYD